MCNNYVTIATNRINTTWTVVIKYKTTLLP